MESFDNHVLKILQAGHLAPSADNTQPWFFNINGSSIIVCHDVEAAHSNHLYNLDYFADYVSLGCVVENIFISSRRYGYTASIASADYSNSRLTIQIKLEKTHNPGVFPLYDAIRERKTNRSAYQEKKIPLHISKELFNIAATRGAELHWIEDKALLSAFSDAIALHDAILWEDPTVRTNLIRMIRPDNKNCEDGLPLKSLGLGIKRHLFYPSIKIAEHIPLLWKVLKYSSIDHTRKNTKKSAALGILTLPQRHDPLTYIEGGRIMQSIWINLEINKVSFQPLFGSVALILNKKIDTKGLSEKHEKIRDKIADFFYSQIPELKTNTPVAIFRAGYADEPEVRSGRRKLEEVLRPTV